MLLTWAGQGLLPQTQTLIAAMTTAPSGARTRLINRTIQQLIASGVWDRCDLIYMLAAHDSQAARLNWKNPGTNTLTVVNTPTFTTDRGYTGDGVSAGLLATPSLSLYSASDAHISAFGLTDSVNTANDVYALNVTPAFRGAVRARSGVNAQVRVSSATSQASVTGATPPAMYLGTRVDSVNSSLYVNGAFDSTAAVAGQVPAITTFSIVGSAAAATFSDRQIASASIGGSLTVAQIAAFYAAELAYLQNLGAV